VTSLESYDGDIKPRYVCELLGMLHGMHTSNVEGVDWTRVAAAMEKFRDNVPKNRNFHDVKKAFNKIGVLLKIKVVQGSEKKKTRTRTNSQSSDGGGGKGNHKAAFFSDLTNGEAKADAGEAKADAGEVKADANGAGAVENGQPQKKGKKSKKRKHNKEALEGKKEKKRHAIDGQFAGMEMPSFSGLTLTDNMNFTRDQAAAAAAAVESEKKKADKKGKKKLKRKSVEAEQPAAEVEQSVDSKKKTKKKKKAKAEEASS
jgi:hypothetical protein